MKKLNCIIIFLSAILVIGMVFTLSRPSDTSRNNIREPEPVAIKQWPGKYTQINQGQRTQTYLFEYDGRKYILVLSTVGGHPTMAMVEHKSP